MRITRLCARAPAHCRRRPTRLLSRLRRRRLNAVVAAADGAAGGGAALVEAGIVGAIAALSVLGACFIAAAVYVVCIRRRKA